MTIYRQTTSSCSVIVWLWYSSWILNKTSTLYHLSHNMSVHHLWQLDCCKQGQHSETLITVPNVTGTLKLQADIRYAHHCYRLVQQLNPQSKSHHCTVTQHGWPAETLIAVPNVTCTLKSQISDLPITVQWHSICMGYLFTARCLRVYDPKLHDYHYFLFTDQW